MDRVKVALVTGSSSGIGEATVKLFARKGFDVVVCGSQQEKVDRVVAECKKLSSREPLGLVLDFSEPKNGQVAISKTIERFERLDVLVNNAGIFHHTPLSNPSAFEEYRNMMAINVDSSVSASLEAVRYLRETKGHIIFISSVASTMVNANSFAYCSSKAAMSMLAKCLAVDLAPDVRVNVVSPGPVATNIMRRLGVTAEMMLEARRQFESSIGRMVGRSEEIAAAIDFLVSESGSFVNGHEMFVDGGFMLRPSSAGQQ